MSHESVPLAYATPAQTTPSAPVRWTLIIWTSLVLIRHGLYWSTMATQSSNWGPTINFNNLFYNLTQTTIPLIVAVIEAVGLSIILFGALDRTGRGIRRFGIGSIFVLIALAITLGLILYKYSNMGIRISPRPTSIRGIGLFLWQLVSAVAGASPVVLAFMTWRESRSAR